MELKRSTAQCSSGQAPVLIEPLWNWNERDGEARHGRGEVLIEPLWNWNSVPVSLPVSLSVY